jgi:CsoR family transcriptional regulator, copper-sensing transcriptional repressor
MPRKSPSRPDDSAAPCGCGAHDTGRKALSVDPAIKASNLARLRRIEGQVRGLQKMVEGDRYCADILTQISSVQEALRGVGRGLLRNHLRHCVTDTLKNAEPASADAMFDELVALFDRQRS